MGEELTNSDFLTAIAFDLNAIIDFIFEGSNRQKTSEIKEIFEKDAGSGRLELVQKIMTEIKNNDLSAIANIRYDLIKMLIEEISSIGMFADKVDELAPTDVPEDEIYAGEPIITTLGQMIALNTLQKEGMISNIVAKEENENG